MIVQTFPAGPACGADRRATRRSVPEEVVLPPSSVIAVVDDDASVRTATTNLLRSRGYAVLTFASADEFLRSPEASGASCVIADVQMPGMNGVDMLAASRTRGCAAPFIFITAFPDEGVRARALKAGAACLLAKPFAGPVLIDCLDVVLRDSP